MAEKHVWTQEEILTALKRIKEGGTVDFSTLPELTPEEQEVFDRRWEKESLPEMIGRMLGDKWKSDGSSE